MEPKILYAEDDHDLREAFCELIEMCLPCDKLLQARTREGAIEIIEAERPNVVITDLRMPARGDGEAVLQKAFERGVPAIVHSGSLDDIGQDIKARCVAVLGKPADVEVILKFIRLALESRKR